MGTRHNRWCNGHTIGNAWGLSTVSWWSHSAAMSAATKVLLAGRSSVCPPGVFSARWSNVTVILLPRLSIPTPFQKRLWVASAPGNAYISCKVHSPKDLTISIWHWRLIRCSNRGSPSCLWRLDPKYRPSKRPGNKTIGASEKFN